MTEMFQGAKLKIKRAEHHIGDLQASVDAFLKTDFHTLGIEHDQGINILKLEAKPLPDEIPLLIGDAVHNLRTALDHVAWEIVTKAGGVPTRWLSFPILETPEKVVAALNGEIKVAGADIVDSILNTIQPYKGGNNALWSLHQIDLVDKHRILVPTVSVTSLFDVRAEDENHNTFRARSMTIGGDGVLRAFATDAKLHIQSYGQATFAVLFQQGQAFEGKPVIPTLRQLVQLVSGIIQTIEHAYVARS